MKKTALILIIMVCFSCKNQDKNQEVQVKEIETPTPEIIDDNILNISMDLVILEDDKLQLFYVDDSPEGTFDVKKRKIKEVKGSEDVQTIVFSLPENAFPYKFRLDLGENNNESIINIKTIKLTYNSKVIDINNDVLERFFQPNIYLEKTEDGYLRKKINGRCDPFLHSKALLIKKMELEL